MVFCLASHSRRAIPGIAVALLLFAGLQLSAQANSAAGSATLKGTVRDAQQKAVSAALVTLQSASQTARATRTDANGKYAFASLPAGAYSLRADISRLGIASSTLTLADNETKQVDLVLAPASSSKDAEFYDEPTFTVAGVSESSGAGVHGSSTTMRNAEALAKSTASLAKEPTQPASDLSTGDYEVAVRRLRQDIAANDRADLHNQLGHLEENSGHPLEAEREFQRAADMEPSERNLLDWGVELLVHRASEPAAEVFQRGSRLYPRSVRMLTALAVAEYARGSYDAAVDRLCAASDLDPHDPTPYIFLGRMQNAEVKRSTNTLAKLARFAELYPKNAEANYYYAIALWNQQHGSADPANIVRVEQLLQRAISLDPKMAPAYLQFGILYSSRQEFPAAAAALERATALDPNLEEAHYRLAQIYRRSGDDAKAQRELNAYKHAADSATEAAERDRKAVQQFVYELKAPPPTPTAQ